MEAAQKVYPENINGQKSFQQILFQRKWKHAKDKNNHNSKYHFVCFYE